jgi:pimeloyl-ACP methyl ester carboxylesterase
MQALLVHGMGRTPLSMFRLGRKLRRAGHTVDLLGYTTAVEPFARIVLRVQERFARIAARGPYVVVGHSLGGLLARAALGGRPSSFIWPAHLIMLGTPNRPPRQARRFGKLLAYRWINGECGQLLTQDDFFAQLPPLSIPYTLVAGTRGTPGGGAFGNEPNDGLVAVSETLVAPSDTPITIPAWHTFMMNDSRALAVILQVLQSLEKER